MSTIFLPGIVPDFYAEALSSAYEQGWPIIENDLTQQREPDIWNKIRLDPKVSQAINQRTSQVAAKNYSIQPASDDPKDVQLAGLIEEDFENTPGFRPARKRMAEGIFRGRAYEFMESDRRMKSLDGGPAMPWWSVTKFKHVDKRRFRLNPIEKGTTKYKSQWELWNIRKREWRPISTGNWGSFLKCTFNDEEERLGYGRPLLESIFFLWWAKKEAEKYGLRALERWSSGWVTAKVDTSTNPGKEGRDSTSIRDAYATQLEKQRARHILVVNKEDDIQVIQGGGEGYQMVRDWIDYCDLCIIAVSMGSVLPFGGQEGVGSLSRAEVEAGVSDELLEFDRGILDEVITEQLIGRWCEMNRSNLMMLGLANAKQPRFITTNPKLEDPKTNVEVIKGSLEAGMTLRRDEAYERVGFSRPNADDPEEDLLRPQDLPSNATALPGPQLVTG